MLRTRSLLLVALPAALLVAVAGAAFWSAQRTLTRSAKVASTQHQLAFTFRVLDPAVARSRNLGFEPVSSSAGYTAGTFFAGDLYLAGPAGLSIYAPDGTLQKTLRTGLELPVAPIVALASGRLRGASDPALLLATAGAGLLLLSPGPHGQPTIHQLLPDTAEARDLTTLLPLASGDLLLGTRHSGVLLFDGSKITPYAATASQALQITALALPDAASVLIGTRNAGLFYAHAGTIQHADIASGLPDLQVDSIVAANGKAYVGTPLGVAQFDLASANAFRPERILAPGFFSHALALDTASSELLVGSLDQGVAHIPLTGRPRLRDAAFSPSQSTQRIDQFLSSASSVYALADGALLLHGNTGWHPALAHANATLADRNISALAFTPDGTLYVGFFDHGLDIFKPGEGSPVNHIEDDHLFCLNRLVLDPTRQTMAAATANGLVLFDRQGTPRQVLTRRDGLISDHVTDLAYTRNGLTIATPAGLTLMGPYGTESLYAFQGLVNNHVYTLGASQSGDRLLAGTLGGISLLEANAVKRNFTATNSGLKHNWITALAPTPNGGWFIGTYGAGIEILSADASRFTPIDLPAGAPRDLVINPNALLVTSSHVFAGTLGHGMLMLDLAANRWSLLSDGLPSLNVTAFAERYGELYVGTQNGLVRIAESKLAGGVL